MNELYVVKTILTIKCLFQFVAQVNTSQKYYCFYLGKFLTHNKQLRFLILFRCACYLFCR